MFYDEFSEKLLIELSKSQREAAEKIGLPLVTPPRPPKIIDK